MIPDQLLTQCHALIAAESEKRMQSGKVPTQNLPHATLLELYPTSPKIPGEDEEIVSLLEGAGSRHLYGIKKGKPKNYVDFWETWSSWPGENGVRRLLENAGFDDAIIANQLMGKIYGGVCYGVLTMIRSPDDQILLGLRATGIAGEFGGFLSLPGGLVRPGELLLQAAARQLQEEVGDELSPKVALDGKRVAMGEHTTAPSFTFIVEGAYPDAPKRATHQSTGVDVHEWAKKDQLVWVPSWLLAEAVKKKDASEVVAYFRNADLNVAPTTRLAGDIIHPLSLLLQ